MDRQIRVLVVEDDRGTRQALAASLRRAGYDVDAFEQPEGAAAHGCQHPPDLAVVDVNLAGVADAGLTLAHQLRTTQDLPVILLTAADTLDDRLAGFAAGADDYLAKPFSTAELLARIEALLRRSGVLEVDPLRIGDTRVDEAARIATRHGRSLPLTRTEFDLLTVLAHHRGKVLTKQELLQRVWGYTGYDTNLVEAHMSNLRRKLDADGALIETVRGVGYRLAR